MNGRNPESPPVASNQMSQQQALWLPCPFCGSSAIEAMWPGHRGCSDPTCGAHMANLSIEQWNRRPAVETFARRAPDWAYADKATGEVWIGEFDDGGNWIPPQRPAAKAAAVPEPITCQLCYGQGGKHQYGCALNGNGDGQ